MLASTVVFLRVFFEVQILTPGVLWQIFPPLCALMAFMLALTIVLFFFTPGKSKTENEMEADPSQLKIALLFGGLYAIVLVAVAGVREYVGQEGLYVVAALSGLTDMNAITLSTARFIHKGQIPADMGWRMIMIGILANLFFKAGVVALLGSRALLTRIVLLFGITIAAGLGILIFWPGHS